MFISLVKWARRCRTSTIYLAAMAVLFLVAFFARPLFGQTPGMEAPAPQGGGHAFKFFAFNS